MVDLIVWAVYDNFPGREKAGRQLEGVGWHGFTASAKGVWERTHGGGVYWAFTQALGSC